ncbi:ABC transporter substrate-binding protein [Thermodesulfobacteriota bacterium]
MINLRTNKLFLTIFACLALWLTGVPWALGQSEHTAKLIEGAKKEGVVVIYGTMNLQDQMDVAAKFQEKYPFLKPQIYRLGVERLLARVLAEKRAGALSADIVQTNAVILHIMKKEGVFGYYLPTDNRFFTKQFKEEGYWTASNISIRLVAYNTRMVSEKEAPKSYEELLDPKWKGKMMVRMTEHWFAGMLQIMGKEKGLNYMRSLSRQNILIQRLSNSMRAQLLAAGEAYLDINLTFGVVEELKNKGGPIDRAPVQPLVAVPSGYGLTARPSHPYAAKLFLDFVLSKEGQKIFMKVGRQVVRSDLFGEQEALKNLQLVPLDPSMGEQMAYYTKQMKEIFSKKK